jgi:hypothetical protein
LLVSSNPIHVKLFTGFSCYIRETETKNYDRTQQINKITIPKYFCKLKIGSKLAYFKNKYAHKLEDRNHRLQIMANPKYAKSQINRLKKRAPRRLYYYPNFLRSKFENIFLLKIHKNRSRESRKAKSASAIIFIVSWIRTTRYDVK